RLQPWTAIGAQPQLRPIIDSGHLVAGYVQRLETLAATTRLQYELLELFKQMTKEYTYTTMGYAFPLNRLHENESPSNDSEGSTDALSIARIRAENARRDFEAVMAAANSMDETHGVHPVPQAARAYRDAEQEYLKALSDYWRDLLSMQENS